MFWEDKNKNGLFGRPPVALGREGSATAAIVLGIVLLAMLLAAHIFVRTRTGEARIHEKTFKKAVQNAEKLIENVKNVGLAECIKTPLKRYYILEKDGATIGYAALSIEPTRQNDGTITIKGTELYRNLYDDMRQDILFSVSNDISSYVYVEKTQHITEGFSESIRQDFKAGALQILYYHSTYKKRLTVSEKVNKANFIPVSLLDFFSSLSAGGGDFADGTIFAMADNAVFRGTRDNVLIECWVRPAEAVPEQIREQASGLHGVEVQWPNFEQTIYYDQDNQLLWQRDTVDSVKLYRKAISLTDLINLFPQADQELKNWLRTDEHDNNREVL